MPEQSKPDWFVSSLNGQIPDTAKLFAQGIGAQDFNLLPAESYWGDESIKQKFNGDKKAFDDFYTSQLGRYDKAKASDRELNNFVTAYFPTKLSQQTGKPQYIVNQSTKNQDPWGRIFINGTPGPKQYGIREKANERGIRMPDGTYVPLSQYDGLSRFAKDDQGRFKFDEDGLPYHEPVPEGQELRSFDESYNSLSDIMGNYGFEYGWKQAAWSPVKNLVNFAVDAADSLAEFPRSIFGINQDLTGGKSNEYNSIKDFQNKIRSWRVSSTEEGQNNFWSIENVVDIAQQAAIQLGGMASIARGAKALGASDKTASVASRMFMTGISAAPLSKISREHGLTDTETAMLMYATLVPLYQVSALSERAINGMKPLQFQAKVADITEDAYKAIINDGINAGSLRKFQNRMMTGLSRTLYGMENTGLGRITQSGLMESLEESAEQGIDMAARGLYDTFQVISNKPEKFNIDLGQEANALLQSAVGGAIGGAAMAPIIRKMAIQHPQIINSYEDAVAQGEEGNIFSFIDNYSKAQRFGDTKEENERNANMFRSILQTMVDIRDRAGVKDVVKNNTEAAGAFSEALKMSSIGKAASQKANELHSLQTKQEELLKQGQSDETIETKINDLKKEIADLVSGRSVNRYIAEGIYNTLTPKELRRIFPGSELMRLNDNTKEMHPVVQDQRKMERDKFLANDSLATADNFKDVGVTEAGRTRLLEELKPLRDSFRSQLTNLEGEEYANQINYDNFFSDDLSEHADEAEKGITKSQSEEDISGDFYEDELSLLSAQKPELADQLNSFKQLRKVIQQMNKLKAYKPVDIKDSTPEDLLLHDIEPNGQTSAATISDKISQQEIESKPKSKDETSLYIDSTGELNRLKDSITARTLQIRGNELLKGKLPEESSLYPIQDAQKLLSSLSKMNERVDSLIQLSEENKKNSEARVKEIYLRSREKELTELENMAAWMAANEFNEIAKKLVPALDAVIDGINKKDIDAHLKAILETEETLFNEVKSKRDAILSKILEEVRGKDSNWLYNTDEGKSYTFWYNYIRGLATVRPATLYKAVRDSIEDSSDKALQPTDEQQYVVIQSVRNLLGGKYDLRPGVTSGDIITAFQAGVDGSSGVGKTSVVVPLVASVISKVQNNQKVVLTAAIDSENAKRTKVINDATSYFGSLPSFIKQTNMSIKEMLQNSSFNSDVSLIVFDEATLIPVEEIEEINKNIIAINNSRILSGNAPLHILYTFDRYQNSSRSNVGRTYSVTSPRVKMPVSPRLTYSFRSQNVSLKMAETYFREIQDGIKPAFSSFQQDNTGGVMIHKNRNEMMQAVEALYNRMSKEGKPDMVYIRTSDSVKTPEVITRIGLPVLTSADAQGREWDVVIVDDNTGEFSTKEKQQEYYTAVTRAKKTAIVFVSPNSELNSVKSSVSVVNPLKATPKTKENLIDRYDGALENYQDAVAEVVKPTTTTVTSSDNSSGPPIDFVPPPPTTEDFTPPSSITSKEEVIPPTEDETERSEITRILSASLPPTVQLSTFFTTSTSPTKREILYNKSTREGSSYQLTIAKIGTPEYTNIINNDPTYNGKYGLMLEAITPSGEKVVLGVLKDSDKMISESGIMKDKEKLTVSISNRVMAEAWQFHPFVRFTKNSEGKNVSSPKTLGMIKESSPGIVFSDVLIAQESSGIEFEGKKVKAGQPFVIASYKHTQEELNNDIRKKRMITDPNLRNDVTIIPLDTRADLTIDQVNEIIKPYLDYKPGGKASIPNSELVRKLVYSFWDGAKNRPDLAKAFEQAKPKLLENPDIVKFVTDKTNSSKRDSYNLSWLLMDYIEEFNSSSSLSKAKAQALRKMIEIVLSSPEFNGKIRFRPAVQYKQTVDVAYLRASSLPGNVMDNLLSNRLDSVSLPVVNLSRDIIASSISGNSTAMKTPDIVTAAPVKTVPDNLDVIPVSSSISVKTDSFDPISLIYFRDTEFPGDKRSWIIPAIRQFKADVANAQLRLTGDSPSLIPVDAALKDLRKYYESTLNKEGDTKQAYINRAINRNFHGLLAKYFPAIKYDLDTDTYSSSVEHIKTEEFGERERFSLIDDGMTNLVKTYLYNTPVFVKEGNEWVKKNDRYITKRDIFHLLPLFKGVNSLPEMQQKIDDHISGKDPIKDQALAPLFSLNVRFFSRYPINIQGVNNHSIHSVSTNEEGWALTDTIFQFLKSGQVFQPGWAEVTTKNRGNRYNTSSFIAPSIDKDIILKSIENSVKSIYKQGKAVAISGTVVEKKKEYDIVDVVDAFRGIGQGSTFSNDNLMSYIKSDPQNQGENAMKYYSNQLMNFFFKAVDAAAAGNKVPLSQEVDPFLEHVIAKEGRGNNFQYMGRDGIRKDMMRFGAPVYNMKSTIRVINTIPSSLVYDNLLVRAEREDNPMISIAHDLYFVDEGVRYRKGKIDREKPTSDMFEDELFEHYVIDGFVSMIGKNNTAYFPVTVYSDSSTEPGIMFRSEDWFRSDDKTLKELFNSRASYYTRKELTLLADYAALGIDAEDIADLASKVSNLDAATVTGSSLYNNLDYIIKGGKVSLKSELVNEIAFYTNPKNVDEFLTAKKSAAEDFIQKAKNTLDADNKSLYSKIEKIARDRTPEAYLKAYYLNWLVASTELQKISNGPAQQYKGEGLKQYFDMVKRSKSQSSPRNSWSLRDPNWKPGLDEKTVYEGSKLPTFIKVAVVTDPVEIGTNLDNGSQYTQEIYDGATFVTPFTRIAQEYSNGLKFGNFVGPVMKNVTTSFDKGTGVNSYIKNAEYSLTPEIMANAGPYAQFIYKGMLTSVSFTVPVNGATNALELLEQVSGNEPVTMDHYRKAYRMMVLAGVQDDIIHEVIPRSSYKTAQNSVNAFDSPKYNFTFLNMSEKGTQQDANKDPFNGLDTRALSQLFDTVLINWRDDALLRQFYDTLSTITKEEMNVLDSLPEESRQQAIRRLMREAVMTNEGADYRTEAVMSRNFSFSDRSLSGIYATTIANYISRRAISFALRGGQYTVHPSDGLVQVVDTPEGVVLKSQAPEGSVSRNLKWKAPIRVSDNKSLDELYKELPIDQVHASLLNDQWSPGEAEILLPAEMRDEFMLESAMTSNLPLHKIDAKYFYTRLLASRELDPNGKYKIMELRAGEIEKSFRKRLAGLMTRIPTSGKHSSINTKIVGFMNESMNSVFAPSQMLRVQGADQDYDKGNYLTYRSVVWYVLKNKKVKGEKVVYSLDPNYGGADWKIIAKRPTGIIPLDMDEKHYYKLIGDEKSLTPEDKKIIRRILLENKLVDSLEKIMSDPKNAVEVNTAVNDTMKPLQKVRDEFENKSTYNFNQDDFFSLTKAHALNQAGGKNLTGIFANGSKAYKILYGVAKYSGRPVPYLAGVDETDNSIWKGYSGLINATVDNGNEQILGPMEIDMITGPMVNYLQAVGVFPEEAYSKYIAPNKQFWDRVRKLSRVDSPKTYDPATDSEVSREMRALLLRTEEYNTFSRSIVNRAIPHTQKDMFNYIISFENYVRRSFARDNKTVPFDFIRFMKDADYAQQMISLYDTLILKSEDGSLNPLSEHTFNILRPFTEMPHIHQYTRALVMSHEMMLSDKTYKTTIDVIRESQRVNPKLRVNSGTYDSVNRFVEMMKVDSYLKNRSMSHLSQFDISNHEGREKFVAEMNNSVRNFKQRYPDNYFIQSLDVTRLIDSVEGSDVLRTYDLFQLTEEKIMELSSALAELTPLDRERFFIYNLITRQDSGSKGGFARFFSYADKMDWNQFVANEYNPDVVYYVKLRNSSEDKDVVNTTAIPYENLPVVGGLSFAEEIRPQTPYKGIPLGETDTITARRVGGVAATTFTNAKGGKTIVYSEKALREKYNSKSWTKPVRLSDGTVATPLPEKLFTSFDSFKNFVIEHEYQHTVFEKPEGMSKGQYEDQINHRAMESIGIKVPDNFSYKTLEQFEEEQRLCKL